MEDDFEHLILHLDQGVKYDKEEPPRLRGITSAYY